MVDGDDFALLERWRSGEQPAGEALCARYFEPIYRFFENKLPGEADDLTQQTFLACVKSRDRFRGASSFRTYLYAIARNELYARVRPVSKLERVDLDSLSLADLVTSPSKRIAQRQDIEQLHAALRQLPVEQQVLLELRYWHDLDIPELTEIFETTAGALRVRLTRARKALRQQLGATLGNDSSDPLSISLRDPEDD